MSASPLPYRVREDIASAVAWLCRHYCAAAPVGQIGLFAEWRTIQDFADGRRNSWEALREDILLRLIPRDAVGRIGSRLWAAGVELMNALHRPSLDRAVAMHRERLAARARQDQRAAAERVALDAAIRSVLTRHGLTIDHVIGSDGQVHYCAAADGEPRIYSIGGSDGARWDVRP